MLQLPKDFVDLHAPAISSLTLVSELCGEQSPVEHHVHHYLDEAGQKSLNIDVRADAVDGWWQQMGSISFGRFQPPSSHSHPLLHLTIPFLLILIINDSSESVGY